MRAKRFLLGALMALLCFGTAAPCAYAAEETLTVSFADVGEADCILLQCGGTNVLLDAAEAKSAPQVLAFLKSRGVTSLDAVFLSHFDQDHVGGMAAVLRAFPVEAVYTSYLPAGKSSREIDDFYMALESAGLTATVIEEETALSIGGVDYTVYPPQDRTLEAKDSNNASLLLYGTYGESRFLLPGDAEKKEIRELLGYGLSCELLKLPHHGRREGNTDKLLDKLQPDFAVICASAYDEKTLTELQLRGIETYLTADGPVTAVSDGKSWAVTQ